MEVSPEVKVEVGEYFICNGYPSVYLPSHPRAYKAGWVYMHILVAEEILGRPLSDEEVVHHKDENRLNFDKSNLLIFATDAEHRAYHSGCEIVSVVNGVCFCERIEKYELCSCGSIKQRGARFCRKCYNLEDKTHFKIDRVYLKSILRGSSFSACARKIGCSDKGLVKICKRLNLPTSRKEIALISDLDWDNL